MLYFGKPWDAPICDDVEQFPEVPTYAKCIRCTHYFDDDSQGFVLPMTGRVDPDYLIGAGDGCSLVGMHRLCMMRDVVGPLVDYRCPTPCDDDCDATCHEFHEVPVHRAHDAAQCEQMVETGRRLRA